MQRIILKIPQKTQGWFWQTAYEQQEQGFSSVKKTK